MRIALVLLVPSCSSFVLDRGHLWERRGSWSQCARKSRWQLPMNLPPGSSRRKEAHSVPTRSTRKPLPRTRRRTRTRRIGSWPQCASEIRRSLLPMNLQPSRTDRGCVRRTSRSVDEGGASVGRPKDVEACGHAAARACPELCRRATPIAAVRFMVFQSASESWRSSLSMNLPPIW